MATVSTLTVYPILALFIFSICVQPSATDFLEEVCKLAVDEGKDCTVDNHQPKFHYYFDTELEECAPFRYKGCGGNENRFALQDDCTDSCQVEWLHRKQNKGGNGTATSFKENCSLPKKVGPCRASIRQFYYDQQAGDCMEFLYGGCKGNKNRFNSLKQCQSACGVKGNGKGGGLR